MNSNIVSNIQIIIFKRLSLHPTAQIKESVPFNDQNKPTYSDNRSDLLGINSSEPLIYIAKLQNLDCTCKSLEFKSI